MTSMKSRRVARNGSKLSSWKRTTRTTWTTRTMTRSNFRRFFPLNSIIDRPTIPMANMLKKSLHTYSIPSMIATLLETLVKTFIVAVLIFRVRHVSQICSRQDQNFIENDDRQTGDAAETHVIAEE